jgi:hypothetical protein
METCTEITTSSLDRDGVLTIINASPRHLNNHLLASPKIAPLHLKNTSSENDSSLLQKSSEESEEESNLHKSDSGNPAISQENLEKEEVVDLQIVDLENYEVHISHLQVPTELDPEFSPINDCLPLSPEEEKDIQHNLQNLPIRKSADGSIMIEEIDEHMNDHIEDNESSEIMGNTDFFKIDK